MARGAFGGAWGHTETPRASNAGSGSSLLCASRIESFCPSGRTPTRPVSFTSRVTMASLPFKAGFFSTPSMRTHVTPASMGPGVAGASTGERSVIPIHPVDTTCAHRGAACTALIHSSLLASQHAEPCSQPMALPASTLTRSRFEPVRTWKPLSVEVTRDLMSTGKSLRCVGIAHAASKMPPGGAVGTSHLLVMTSNAFFLGCMASLRALRRASRPISAASSSTSAKAAPIVRRKRPVSSVGAQKAMPATATAARSSEGARSRALGLGGSLGSAGAPASEVDMLASLAKAVERRDDSGDDPDGRVRGVALDTRLTRGQVSLSRLLLPSGRQVERNVGTLLVDTYGSSRTY